jgi:hypothetical protein
LIPATAYFCALDARNLGESLPLLSLAACGERRARIYWWLNTDNGHYHPEMLRIYQQAGLFRYTIQIAGMTGCEPEEGDGPAGGPILQYIRRVYGVDHDRLLPAGDSPDFPLRAVYMPDELRRLFCFLEEVSEQYITCHPASVANSEKTAGIGLLIERLAPYVALHPQIRVLGLPDDRPYAEKFIAAAREAFPAVKVVDFVGKTDLHGFMRTLYGSHFHICADTCSAFFTAQLGIESELLGTTDGLERFERWFEGVPTLKIIRERKED